MKGVQEVTRPVAGSRRPLRRSNRIVCRFAQGAGEPCWAGTVAEGEQLWLEVHLLGLLLLREKRGRGGSGVVCRAEQQGVVVLRDELLCDRCGNGRSALIVGDINTQRMADALHDDAALAVDPVLTKEVALFGHLPACRLTAGE